MLPLRARANHRSPQAPAPGPARPQAANRPPRAGRRRRASERRNVAADLGPPRVATLVKRALQFGTRIAPFSNRLCFGSNRKGDGTAAFDVDLLLSRIEGVGVS